MADAVTVEEVRHVAMLARLGLTDQRATELARDLSTILRHMEVLGGIDTTGLAEATGPDGGMPLRDDAGPPAPLAEPPDAFAPEMRAGLFIVPRLSTHEGTDAFG